MKPAINEASARHRSGELSPVRDLNGNRNGRPYRADIAEVERQIAALVDRSTQDLRVTWRQLHRNGPPPGSVVTCSSEPSRISCKSEPMAA